MAQKGRYRIRTARGEGQYGEAEYGEDNANVADVLDYLGIAYDMSGDHAKARELYESALAIF